ncbi:MAG: c-type cytochrome biogenesis protein CcmI [Candidatus Azotimanducaceae bacterium]|uniref:C-type cytochrome biogenesis protein CcmI n=1 Tax=OM182 bacterium TaxID=2510334 RepID=A0A520S0N9_9GAMM|nr:c-type cytochrome biogenesis protein CcmI [Gammaproteobacteria bacterium]OUV68051.1 MAG: c-type cytochrome biogenesis protein CcmI [Gammaproteobacteria bacterium TMED133]RZO76029.1 MAG: c-type cytochrome biogenesis protein CcmI [OM182 bacterium]
MLMFWIGALILCILAITFIVWPLYGRGDISSLNRSKLNIELFHNRITELENSLEQAEINEGEFKELERELQLSLVSDTRSDLKSQSSISRLPFFAAAMVVVLSIFAFADFGLSMGSVGDFILSKEIGSTYHNAAGMQETMEKLERRLQQEPDNDDARFLLAQSWQSLAEYEKAAREFRYLVERYPLDSALAVRFAGALFLLDMQAFTPRVRLAISKALELNPHDIEMLELSAIDAFRQGNAEKASTLLRQALVYAEGSRADLLRQALSDLTNNKYDLTEVAKTSLSNERSLNILVELGAEVEANPEATVYVYARPFEGSTIPLALERLTIAQLPALITLKSDRVMIEGMGLNDFDLVQIVARISEKGIANASPEDYEVVSGAIDLKVEHSVFRLTISNRRG